ncbi:MAG: M23 family metallopeptidase [Bacteroidales bacterium]|nr:M23 family metallopeptidase [Bacteroidales bacterium]
MGFKDWWNRLKDNPVTDVIKRKHRFVVRDEDTYKEKLSFRLSVLNLFVTIGTVVIVLIVLTTVLIAFTPLREFIPGYTDIHAVEQTYANAKQLDSLQVELERQEWLITTLQVMVRGDEMGQEVDELRADSSATLSQVAGAYRHSREDSILRKEVESEDNKYEVKAKSKQSVASQPVDAAPAITRLFFTPLKGSILTPFSASHRGVDIGGDANTRPVCAAYSGTVVFTGFSADAGHTLVIQHPGSVLTIYKNNSSILKKQGDAVRAGEPVAFVGNSGRRELGPYLHFEIWVGGVAVNPEEYISF